jgi:hypothetical protein
MPKKEEMPIPSFEEVMASIDADEAMDNSPEQKDLEAALAQLDAEIAAGRSEKKDADSD